MKQTRLEKCKAELKPKFVTLNVYPLHYTGSLNTIYFVSKDHETVHKYNGEFPNKYFKLKKKEFTIENLEKPGKHKGEAFKWSQYVGTNFFPYSLH